MTGQPPTPGVVQVFEQARTAHLERLVGSSVQLFHRTRSYDFDPHLASAVGARCLSRLGIVRSVVAARPAIVEINEPLFLRSWPTIAAALVGAWLTGVLGGRRVRVVTYAIANDDPVDALAQRLPVVGRIAGRVLDAGVRVWLRATDKVAFGTDAAAETYARHMPVRSPQARTFPPLTPPCPCGSGPKDPVVLFLGALEPRKGIHDVMTSWDEVHAAAPGSRLVLLGTGPAEAEVRAWVASRPETRLVLDPSREAIHRELRGATVLTLPSRRTARWREQIGLPLLEGLAHGCEIVTTPETGLASWLAAHGHRVVESPGLARALVDALATRRTPDAVLSDLPRTDGRAVAAAWLHGR